MVTKKEHQRLTACDIPFLQASAWSASLDKNLWPFLALPDFSAVVSAKVQVHHAASSKMIYNN